MGLFEETVAPTTAAPQPPSSFGAFWESYPRKVCKQPAEKAYAKAVKKAGAVSILEGLNRWKVAWQGTDKQFIPHATTWLNQERWRDTPDSFGNGDTSIKYVDRPTTTITRAFDAVETLRKKQPLGFDEARALQEWKHTKQVQRRARNYGLTL